MNRVLLTLVAIFSFGIANADSFTDSFENISPNNNLADPAVYSFAQDKYGYIYIGTNDGLNRFDGYRFSTYTHIEGDSCSLSNSRINCLLSVNDTLYVGTDKGVNIYNKHNDSFCLIASTETFSIKFILQDYDGQLWFGTNYGVILYKNHQIIRYSRQKGDFPFAGDYVPCGYLTSNRQLYMGTHQYLCKLLPNNTFEEIPLPFNNKLNNNLLLSIIENNESATNLWLGTEQGLINYNTENHEATLVIESTPIKTLHYDENGNLWIGSDNGLYVRPKNSNSFIHKTYTTDNSHTIANNVIWTIFNDHENNLWFGTDNGISIKPAQMNYNIVTIKEMTGSNEGNQLFTIYHDRHDNLWLGGSNGLIQQNLKTKWVKWFKSDNKSLSHNKVRYLYEDQKSLWIATDGGLNRYDYETQQIKHYNILERSGLYNSNWMYTITEDNHGYLWLGTYEGGIFVVNKKKIEQSNSTNIIADNHFNNKTATMAISSNIVNSIFFTQNDLTWLGTGNSGIDCIDNKKRIVLNINNKKDSLNSNQIKCIYVANQSLWIGTNNGLNLLQPPYDKVEKIVPEINLPIRFLTVQDSNVWFSTRSGMACYNINSKNINNIHFDNLYGSCIHYYEPEHKMYVGTDNGYVVFTPDSLLRDRSIPSIKITQILIDNQQVKPFQKINGRVFLRDAMDETDEIEMKNNENNFGLEFSTFSNQKGALCYAYRLKGFNDEWQLLEGVFNKVSYTNIPAGQYTFEVQTIDNNRHLLGNITTLTIRILPPWYQTNLLYGIYGLLLIGLVFVFSYRIHRKHQIEKEQFEREKTLNLTRMKLDFFANISHEFKTPLSLIIGYISRLTMHESNNEQKRQLTLVQKNAEKLHALINQMLDYKEEKESNSLICAETSLAEFTREIFDQFNDAFMHKHIEARFCADESLPIFLLDRVKMESVLTNLLSNALKFVAEGGKITMEVQRTFEDEKGLDATIRIIDNGCGITTEDLPKVFDRYFISTASQHMNKEGSGIGLSLAKQIVEQHGGSISIESVVQKGTTVTVKLHTDKQLINNIETTNLPHPLNFRPTLLLVEDNTDLQEYITSSLNGQFDFHTAVDGKEGYKVALEVLPDLIITDLMMPNTDGFALCQLLKENIHTATIPVIILTAKNDRETEMHSFEYADAFISKPFDLTYLLNLCVKLIIKSQKMAEKSRQKEISTPKDETIISPDERFLQQITQIIEDSLSDPDLNVTTLCQKCDMNDKQVYRKIKQLTGKSVVEYIRNIRLKKAAMFLRQNKLSVSEIMYLVGFSNASYFTKCFKDEYGISPKEFATRNE